MVSTYIQIHYSQYEEKYKQAHVLKVKEYIEASNKTIVRLIY